MSELTNMDINQLLTAFLPADRVKTKLIDLVSSAPDAGFYYLKPKAVVQPVSEEEVRQLFLFSHQHNIPLTFRTGGTSLSGQAVTDGILVDLSRYWRDAHIENNGEQIRVQPGVIGGMANTFLKKYKRKIGPDPASINAAMMGGILSNNASGMCCGVRKNSYHTAKYIRFMLPDGKAFTTERPLDYERFENECPDICNALATYRNQLLGDTVLYNKIRAKYQTKNTVGYSVNALIDFEHPLDMFAHLLIGAEGTLGFIAEAVMDTVPDYPEKSTSMLYFNNIYDACSAIIPLKEAGAEAVELMDRSSLRSIEHISGIPAIISTLPGEASALLVEFQAENKTDLQDKVDRFLAVSPTIPLLEPPVFTQDAYEQAFLWKIRKGMFPAVGAVRTSGTTVILEDIAFPVEHLGDAILDLHYLFKKYQYHNAIIFGHAKDGNIHFVVTQAFDSEAEIKRYDLFLREVIDVVVHKYNGALKAEHGTGRNMSPFVETEWGPEIYRIMKGVKEVVDPHNLLNPGVIINHDPQAHIKDLKDLPSVEQEVDKCIECGFCEHKCPSRDITLTPRKRIVVRRELVKLKDRNKADYKILLDQYQYQGLDTCAVDGLCATVCPVDINTGTLVKRLRREQHGTFSNKVALLVAKNFKPITSVVRAGISAGVGVNRVLGNNTLLKLTRGLKKVVSAAPLWSNQLKPTAKYDKYAEPLQPDAPAVLYFPTCISRSMGGSAAGKQNVVQTFIDVSRKAGIKFTIPEQIAASCCGQIFSSKGFPQALEYTVNKTISDLWEWTNHGTIPVVLDITSCTQSLQTCQPHLTPDNQQKFDQLKIIDSIDYLADYLLPRVTIRQPKQSIVLHPVCSLQKMGNLEKKLNDVARQLAVEVKIPVHAGCCGMAGDRGFMFPELTAAATRQEANDVKAHECSGYYSTSKTCEIALSEAVGKNYESLIYLLADCI